MSVSIFCSTCSESYPDRESDDAPLDINVHVPFQVRTDQRGQKSAYMDRACQANKEASALQAIQSASRIAP